jgi:O-acetyl-ADP-ribose deacetylase (regulator of RNase III)
MLRYAEGNLLEAPAEALVNTVNEVGVMGKGIALMFRETFPESARQYERAAKAGEIRVGRVFVTENRNLIGTGPRWIIHFPTKKHWRNPSKLEWVREGLQDLKRVINEMSICSIALPPLGCGSGGLDWELVRREIVAFAEDLPTVDLIVFGPADGYRNVAKREGVEELTPARALVAELVRRYAILGFECSNLEVQKLAYFLSRWVRALMLPDPLRLDFKANKYGPYADRLRHLLNGLDGSYLHSEKRLSDAGPLDRVWFEDSKKDKLNSYLHTSAVTEYLGALEKTAATIDGFESPLGLELLATVDWLVNEADAEASIRGIRAGLSTWPGGGEAAGRRKRKLFDERLIGLALDRLNEVAFPSAFGTAFAGN